MVRSLDFRPRAWKRPLPIRASLPTLCPPSKVHPVICMVCPLALRSPSLVEGAKKSYKHNVFCLFCKYLQGTYHVPGSIRGVGHTALRSLSLLTSSLAPHHPRNEVGVKPTCHQKPPAPHLFLILATTLPTTPLPLRCSHTQII